MKLVYHFQPSDDHVALAARIADRNHLVACHYFEQINFQFLFLEIAASFIAYGATTLMIAQDLSADEILQTMDEMAAFDTKGDEKEFIGNAPTLKKSRTS